MFPGVIRVLESKVHEFVLDTVSRHVWVCKISIPIRGDTFVRLQEKAFGWAFTNPSNGDGTVNSLKFRFQIFDVRFKHFENTNMYIESSSSISFWRGFKDNMNKLCG